MVLPSSLEQHSGHPFVSVCLESQSTAIQCSLSPHGVVDARRCVEVSAMRIVMLDSEYMLSLKAVPSDTNTCQSNTRIGSRRGGCRLPELACASRVCVPCVCRGVGLPGSRFSVCERIL